MTLSAEHLEPTEIAPSQDQRPFHVLFIFWKRKVLVALGLVMGLTIGALYYVQLSPVYQATAQILVIRKTKSPLPSSETDPRHSYYDDYLATHQVLIKSPLIVQKAVDKHQLHALDLFQGQTDATASIVRSLAAARESGTSNNLLALSFRGGKPEDCVRVLNAVIDSYKDFLDETYQTVSSETLAQITRATETLQKSLDQKIKAYEEFQQSSPLVYWKRNEASNPQEDWLRQIHARRLSLLLRRAELQGRLASLERALKEGRNPEWFLAQTSTSAARPAASSFERTLEEQVSSLVLQEKMLLTETGPDHPQVLAVRKRLAVVRELLAQTVAERDQGGPAAGPGGRPDSAQPSVQRHLQSLKQELADVDASLQTLTKLFNEEQEENRRLGKYKDEDKRHSDGIAQTRQLFEPIIRRLEEIKLVQDLGGYRAQVITPPEKASMTGPGAATILLMAGVLGLLGGMGLAFVTDLTDQSFRTPAEIRHRLGLPVIGHIPLFTPESPPAEGVSAEGDALDPILCVHYQSQSAQAESYRGLRTALYASTQGKDYKILQVTSPDLFDGKTTLVANLGVSIAQSGKRTLLVDCDFRKPRLHQIFAVPADQGLASVLTGEAALTEVVRPTRIPGLALLPCGPCPPNPAELLTSPRFAEVLHAVRQEYDFVLVDTPPLLAVSDPSVVAACVDGVVLTLTMTKQGRPKAERSLELLKTSGAHVLGVVVNRVEAGDSSRYGYWGYLYHYNNRKEGSSGSQDGGTHQYAAVDAQPEQPQGAHAGGKEGVR